MRQLSQKLGSLLQDVRIEKQVIKHDLFDLQSFQEIVENNPSIAKIYTEGSENYPQFEELHQDVYDALFKYNPELLPTDIVEYEYLLNHKVMGSVLESPKYKELRALTKLDVVHSTIGAEVLGNEVKNTIEQYREEAEQQLQEAIDAAEQLKAAQEAAEESSEEGEEGTGASSDTQYTLEQAQARLEEAMKTLTPQIKRWNARSQRI